MKLSTVEEDCWFRWIAVHKNTCNWSPNMSWI